MANPKFKPGDIVKVENWSDYYTVEKVLLKNDSRYEYKLSDSGTYPEDELSFFVHKDLKVTFSFTNPVLGVYDDYYKGKELSGDIEWESVETETFSMSYFSIPDDYFTDRDLHDAVIDIIERERKKWVLERLYKLFSHIHFK